MKTYDFNTGVNVVSQKFYETDLEFHGLYLEFIKVLYNQYLNFPSDQFCYQFQNLIL